MNQNNKKTYIAPEIKVTLIELEESIAAGSATAKPGNSSGQVMEEWDDQGNVPKTYPW